VTVLYILRKIDQVLYDNREEMNILCLSGWINGHQIG